MKRNWLWLGLVAVAIWGAGGCFNPPPVAPNEEDGGATDGSVPILDDAGMNNDDGGATDGGVPILDDAGVNDDDAGAIVSDAGEDGGIVADAGVDGGVTPKDICSDVAKKKCDYFIRCRSDGTSNQGRGNDQVSAQERAACEARETTLACEVIARGWELGRATVDTTKYLKCIDASYPANTCARDLNSALAACMGTPYIVGATPNGGLCTTDLECSAGYCSVTNGAACGTCQPYLPNGRACQRNEQCDPSTSYCGGFGSQTCRRYTALNSNCTTDRECGPGNVCAGTGAAGLNRVCKAAVPLGGTCIGGRFECARHPDPSLANNDLPETICSVNSGTGTCIAVQSPLGGVCANGERLTPLNMARGPFCNETEFCAAGLCTPRRMPGQPCTSTDQCALGTYCDNQGSGATNTCVAYKELGDACSGTSPDRCKNLLSCQGATCQPTVAALGGNCNANVTCSEGYCDPGTNKCTALKPNGQACTSSQQCESNSCVMGTCAAACWQ